MTEAINADVTVVGSGLLGLAAAYELLRRDLHVAVIGPRGRIGGSQASRAAGAMLTVFSEVEAGHPLGRVETEVSFRIAARQLYSTWLQDLSEASGISLDLDPGVWVIANGLGDDDAAELAAIHAAAHRHGWTADYGTPADVPGLRPQLRAFETLWLPWEASVDPMRIMEALESILSTHPRCAWIDAPARGVRERNEYLVVNTDNEPPARSRHLVLAAGAATGHVIDGALAATCRIPPVLSGRGVSLVVQAPFELPTAVRTPNRGFACGTHLVPRGDGSVYLGATNRLSTDPDYTRGASLDEIATLIHDGAAELHSGLRDATLVRAQVGHRPVTLDHLPLIGTTAHPMIHMASATYRCGVLLAPLAANVVADCVTTPGSHADHPYRPTREMAIPPLPEMLQGSAHGLVDMLCQPGGYLPAGADEMLANFLLAALTDMAAGSGTRAAVMRRVWQRAPMLESVPLLLDAVGRLG